MDVEEPAIGFCSARLDVGRNPLEPLRGERQQRVGRNVDLLALVESGALGGQRLRTSSAVLPYMYLRRRLPLTQPRLSWAHQRPSFR